jgi:hypothetical protein
MPNKKIPLIRKNNALWGKIIHRKEYCERCKRRGLNYNAHHAKCKNRYPRLRHEIRNGVLLCIDCHRWAHADPIQFSEWMKKERTADWKWLKEQTKASGKVITYQGLEEKNKELNSLPE